MVYCTFGTPSDADSPHHSLINAQQPFGLSHHFPFAQREDVERIKVENPHLAYQRFHVTRSTSRPFWISHGTIVGPQWAKVHDMLPIQFTAIYSGSPYLHKMHYRDIKHPSAHKDLWVGGGLVDSFAFGGEEPGLTKYIFLCAKKNCCD